MRTRPAVRLASLRYSDSPRPSHESTPQSSPPRVQPSASPSPTHSLQRLSPLDTVDHLFNTLPTTVSRPQLSAAPFRPPAAPRPQIPFNPTQVPPPHAQAAGNGKERATLWREEGGGAQETNSM